MNLRHLSRQTAFQFLYQMDIATQELDPEMLNDSVEQYFEHFNIPENCREFAKKLICGTIAETKGLDSAIESHSENWRIGRMPLVDRNLIRLALYEMNHIIDSPEKVTIDEAIELAKTFGTKESPPFVNGILDSMMKKINDSTDQNTVSTSTH